MTIFDRSYALWRWRAMHASNTVWSVCCFMIKAIQDVDHKKHWNFWRILTFQFFLEKEFTESKNIFWPSTSLQEALYVVSIAIQTSQMQTNWIPSHCTDKLRWTRRCHSPLNVLAVQLQAKFYQRDSEKQNQKTFWITESCTKNIKTCL